MNKKNKPNYYSYPTIKTVYRPAKQGITLGIFEEMRLSLGEYVLHNLQRIRKESRKKKCSEWQDVFKKYTDKIKSCNPTNYNEIMDAIGLAKTEDELETQKKDYRILIKSNNFTRDDEYHQSLSPDFLIKNIKQIIDHEAENDPLKAYEEWEGRKEEAIVNLILYLSNILGREPIFDIKQSNKWQSVFKKYVDKLHSYCNCFFVFGFQQMATAIGIPETEEEVEILEADHRILVGCDLYELKEYYRMQNILERVNLHFRYLNADRSRLWKELKEIEQPREILSIEKTGFGDFEN